MLQVLQGVFLRKGVFLFATKAKTLNITKFKFFLRVFEFFGALVF